MIFYILPFLLYSCISFNRKKWSKSIFLAGDLWLRRHRMTLLHELSLLRSYYDSCSNCGPEGVFLNVELTVASGGVGQMFRAQTHTHTHTLSCFDFSKHLWRFFCCWREILIPMSHWLAHVHWDDWGLFSPGVCWLFLSVLSGMFLCLCRNRFIDSIAFALLLLWL